MLIVLSLILFILMLAIGGERGMISFLALIGNIIILLACLYGMAGGISPILITVICSIIFIYITLFCQNGINIKTITSAIAVVIVEILLSVLILICVYGGHAGGYSEVDMWEDTASFLSSDLSIPMNQVMVAILLLGALGTIMDTYIAISSAMFEMNRNNPLLTVKELSICGYNVAKDIMGTTVNTVFFACLGETTMLTILFIKFGYTFQKLINSKSFYQEVILIFISNIGCLIIIPIVVYTFCFLVKSENKHAVKIKKWCDKIKKENDKLEKAN